ncbi:phosphoribosyltransferase family protein [Actinospica robiniae]|uniref:phosphoribosyltransferase family protein n=1 Tax=Actinospica robiniae TaxID=304901 RepID=UPI0003F87FF9|nr:phosphoribosyltransferase family protein [Actinospica robiniae]
MSASSASYAAQHTLKHFRWVNGHADVWAVFRDAEALRALVIGLAEPVRADGVTAVCGIESRGFLLGAAVAVELGVGFVPVRKGIGLLPGDKAFGQTAPDYRGLRHTLRLQREMLGEGDRVLLVDDWIETGAQAATVRAIVEQCGAAWAGCSVLVDQLSDDRRACIGPVRSVLRAAELPADALALPAPGSPKELETATQGPPPARELEA